MYDVIIIGAGITGSFIAHDLSKYQLKVLVLEKEIEVCSGVSKANSAIIHPGFDPTPNTLKATLNVLGNKMYDSICKALNVRIKRVGSYTLATNQEEETILDELAERAKLNGVFVSIVDRTQLLRSIPNLADEVTKGLYAKTTKIISPWEMVYALLENAVFNGVSLKTDCEVIDIKKNEAYFDVITKDHIYKTRYIINASGLYAKKLYQMVSQQVDFNMVPTKGQYYVLDKDYSDLSSHVLYPTPNKNGKGVLVVPTIEGNMLLGPTSVMVSELNNQDTTREEFEFVKKNVKKIIKMDTVKGVIHSFCGVRPKTDQSDFIIEEASDVPHFINVAGIESPGLAASPAISQRVISIFKSKEQLIKKDHYHLYKARQVRFNELSVSEKRDLIKEDPRYGVIVCRCEEITEKEIIDAIHSIVPVKTVDGVKRRCRAGMGRCQGGFCQSRIVEILARELKKSKLDVLLNCVGSNILIKETKEGDEIDV